jgi:hypothetical protein
VENFDIHDVILAGPVLRSQQAYVEETLLFQGQIIQT